MNSVMSSFAGAALSGLAVLSMTGAVSAGPMSVSSGSAISAASPAHVEQVLLQAALLRALSALPALWRVRPRTRRCWSGSRSPGSGRGGCCVRLPLWLLSALWLLSTLWLLSALWLWRLVAQRGHGRFERCVCRSFRTQSGGLKAATAQPARSRKRLPGAAGPRAAKFRKTPGGVLPIVPKEL